VEIDLRADPGARAELEAARAWGVSWSVFTGQEPPGARWTEQDTAGALALAELEASICSGCKGFLPETTDARNEFAYQTSPPIRCHRCTHLEMIRDTYADQHHSSALMFLVELNPDKVLPPDPEGEVTGDAE
jgi:hypothetical protein